MRSQVPKASQNTARTVHLGGDGSKRSGKHLLGDKDFKTLGHPPLIIRTGSGIHTGTTTLMAPIALALNQEAHPLAMHRQVAKCGR